MKVKSEPRGDARRAAETTAPPAFGLGVTGLVTLGMFEGDASLPTVETQSAAEMLANSDRYGKSQYSAIYQGGVSTWRGTTLEFRTGALAAAWPYGAIGTLGVVGRDLWVLSAPLVMTATAGTPAAAGVGLVASLTAPNAILSPGFSSRWIFGPVLRKVPLQMSLFLGNVGGGTVGWYSTSALLLSVGLAFLGLMA